MWKRKTNKQEGRRPSPIVEKVNGRINQVQRQWASKMNSRTAHWNQRQKIFFLFIACGALAALNLLVLLDDSKATKHFNQKAYVVPIPKHWFVPDIGPRFTRRDTAVFLAFRNRLDSLNASEEGRARLKEFTLSRPGFLDSVLHVERQIFPTLPPLEISSPNKPLTP